MFKINIFALDKLNNAEFVAFFINLANLIERAEASKLGLDADLVAEFVKTKELLNDQVRVSQASDQTKVMNDAHNKRVRMFRLCYLSLQKAALTDGPAKEFVPKIEQLIFKPYPITIASGPKQELTTLISGFVMDMRNIFSEDDLDDMGVATELSNLESANQEYIAAYANRTDQRASFEGELTKRLRAQITDQYTNISFAAQYMANSSSADLATKADACRTFIAQVNQVLADVKARYNQRMAYLHKQTDEKPTDEKPTDEEPTDENPTNGSNTGSGGNNEPAIDHENGTVHDGTVEF